jgi:hypothetical protein
MGVTYGFLGWPPDWGPIPSGLRGGVHMAIMMTKIAIARTLRWSDERRVHVEMTAAHARGYLRGRSLARSRAPSA